MKTRIHIEDLINRHVCHRMPYAQGKNKFWFLVHVVRGLLNGYPLCCTLEFAYESYKDENLVSTYRNHRERRHFNINKLDQIYRECFSCWYTRTEEEQLYIDEEVEQWRKERKAELSRNLKLSLYVG